MDRRRTILEAACWAVAKDGLQDARVSDVAQAAGVSPSLVYKYFSPREQLFKAALAYADERSAGAIAARVDAGARGANQLLQMFEAAFDEHAQAHEDWILWSEVSAHARFDPELGAIATRWGRRWIGSIDVTLRRGRADGSIRDRSGEVDAIATTLAAQVMALGISWARGAVPRTEIFAVLTPAAPRT